MQGEYRMMCASRVHSHSGFTPGVSTERIPVCGSVDMSKSVTKDDGRDRRGATEKSGGITKSIRGDGYQSKCKENMIYTLENPRHVLALGKIELCLQWLL